MLGPRTPNTKRENTMNNKTHRTPSLFLAGALFLGSSAALLAQKPPGYNNKIPHPLHPRPIGARERWAGKQFPSNNQIEVLAAGSRPVAGGIPAPGSTRSSALGRAGLLAWPDVGPATKSHRYKHRNPVLRKAHRSHRPLGQARSHSRHHL